MSDTPAKDGFEVLHEFVAPAKKALSKETWDYLMGGADTETTLERNRRALDSLAFRPRVLRNVAKVDMSTEFLGAKLRLPVILAPIGSLQTSVRRAASPPCGRPRNSASSTC